MTSGPGPDHLGRFSGLVRGLRPATLALLPALGFVSYPESLSAQEVNGVVTTNENGERVEGSMIVLIDAGGEVVDRSLTDARGAFSLEADAPGSHTLRVERIGFARFVDGPFQVPRAGVLRHVRVTVQAIRLSGIDVYGAKRCDVRPDEGRNMAQVWEEIRKALEAAEWTSENAVYRYTLLNYRHVTDRRRREVLDEQRSFQPSRDVAPFYSIPVDDLVDGGFVQSDHEGGTMYYAPDAAAFLSHEFLNSHCFGLRSRDGELGLTFGPLPDRFLPDIEGTMWLDIESATLEKLEFTYVNVPNPRDLEPAKGFVGFTAMPNGTWIVKDWEIDMPMWAQPPGEIFGRAFRRIRGGATWRVSDRTGTIVLEAATATVGGRVAYVTGPAAGVPPDSAAADLRPGAADVAALAGDTTLASHYVRIAGTGENAEVNADGSFVLPGLAEGRQSIEVRHPFLDTMGFRSRLTAFEATLGSVVALDLDAPRTPESLAYACFPEGGDPVRPPLLARFMGRNAPLAGAEVVVGWSGDVEWPRGEKGDPPLAMPPPNLPEIEGEELRWSPQEGPEGVELRTLTDARGMLVLCEPPYDGEASITVRHGGESWVRDLPEAANVPAVILVYNLH